MILSYRLSFCHQEAFNVFPFLEVKQVTSLDASGRKGKLCLFGEFHLFIGSEYAQQTRGRKELLYVCLLLRLLYFRKKTILVAFPLATLRTHRIKTAERKSKSLLCFLNVY